MRLARQIRNIADRYDIDLTKKLWEVIEAFEPLSEQPTLGM
jgi:hypothetical protein